MTELPRRICDGAFSYLFGCVCYKETREAEAGNCTIFPLFLVNEKSFGSYELY
jgi:hypothetical protein